MVDNTPPGKSKGPGGPRELREQKDIKDLETLQDLENLKGFEDLEDERIAGEGTRTFSSAACAPVCSSFPQTFL